MPTIAADTKEAQVAPASPNGAGPASLDAILAASDTRYETVHVAEWGLDVRLVSLSGLARNRIALAQRDLVKRMGEEQATAYFQAQVILASMVDADGNPIGDPAKAEALMGKNGNALTTLWLVCRRLSGIGTEDDEVDDLKGTPNGGSGSD